MFNIILKLNNHLWKKLQNYLFVEKNETQISGFAVAKKAWSSWKKNQKKGSSSLFVRIWSSKLCVDLF